MKKKNFVIGIILATIIANWNFPSVNAENNNEFECTIPFSFNEDEIVNIDNLENNQFNVVQSYYSNDDAINLPSKVDLSESGFLPPIGDQKSFMSCVSWSTTYYQMTYEINKLESQTLSKDYQTSLNLICSPMFSFNISNNGNANRGSSMDNMYNLIQKHGVVFCNDLDANSTDFSWITDSNVLINAFNYKLSNVNSLNLYSNSIYDNDLNKIKSELANGKVLTILGLYGSDNKQIDKTSIINSDGDVVKTDQNIVYEVLYNTDKDANNGTHSMAVIGYDDDIWYDANNNGIPEIGEKGAFKLANSWGEKSTSTNNGYIWVLYDALRSESIIPNYQELSNDTFFRVPCFSVSVTAKSTRNKCYYGNNIFYEVDVIKQNTKLVGEIKLSTNYRNQLELSYGTNNTYSKLFPVNSVYDSEQSTELAFDGPIIFDFTDEYNKYNFNELNNVNWMVKLNDTLQDGHSLTNITYCLKDNLNNVVANYTGDITNLDGDETEKSLKLNLVKGDLNYTQKIDINDIYILKRYLHGNTKLSYLQQDLADINNDSVVNEEDYTALISIVAPKEAFISLSELGVETDLKIKVVASNGNHDYDSIYTLDYDELDTATDGNKIIYLPDLNEDTAKYTITLLNGQGTEDTSDDVVIYTIDDLNQSVYQRDKYTLEDESKSPRNNLPFEISYYPESTSDTDDNKSVGTILLKTYVDGDINLSSSVDAYDLTVLKKYVLGMYNFIQTGTDRMMVINNGYSDDSKETYYSNNVTINGNISSNGYLEISSQNGNINGELNAQRAVIEGNINHSTVGNETFDTSLLLTDEEITSLYFTDVNSADTYTDNPYIQENNLTIDNDIICTSSLNISSTNSINLNSSIKSKKSIVINGSVKNTHDSVIYSSDGNITITGDNINYNGIIYAPNGIVTIKATSNVKINGTVIAKELYIETPNLNFDIQDYQTASNSISLSDLQLFLANMFYDDTVDVRDLAYMKKKILGLY